MRLAPTSPPLVPALLALALAASAAPAGEHVRPSGRFDDRVRHLEGGPVLVKTVDSSRLDESDPLGRGWSEFRSRHGQGWKIHLDERTAMPALAAGPGLVWFDESALASVSMEAVEAKARQFLAENRGLLGGDAAMESDREASFRSRNGHWQLVFRQVANGVRVENARLELHLKRGRLMMFGASNWGRLVTDGVPRLSAEKARAALDAYVGSDTGAFEQVGEPELTLRAVDAAPAAEGPRAWDGPRGEGLGHVLLWRFRFRDPGAPATWVGEIDARDGSVRAFYDGTEYASVRGGVFPSASDGECAAGGCEIGGFPMPFADFEEAGQSREFTDPYGNLACSLETATFETTLKGPYVRIEDTCGQLVEAGSCEAGVDLGLKQAENCDPTPAGSPGNTAAARTAYYHINRIAEVARFYDPTNNWLHSPLTVNVNINSSCNANWDLGQINMYGAGSNCSNTGENPGVLIHEWGHGYDFNDGGGRDKPGEAYADITMIVSMRDSCMGRGMYNDGSTCDSYGDTCQTCTGFREFDWEARSEPHEPSTPNNWAATRCGFDFSIFGGPCARQAHCESFISSEAIYDLATRDLPAMGMDQASAWQLVERLWFETRQGSGGDGYFCSAQGSDSCGVGTWYQKMRAADDDDGNLANGTPHAAALFAAFDRHALACGAVDDPENQNSSSCPTLDPPVLAVTETAPGTQLSWNAVAGAAEYRVYRGELGCDRQQVPIASLGSGQTSFLDDVADQDQTRAYRVQVFGSNPVCASPVSTCEATSSGARLQQSSYRLIESDTADGIPQPGETLQIPVSYFNTGGVSASSVQGGLRLISPSQVRLLKTEATWADIPPLGVEESNAPYLELLLLEQASCGDLLTVEVEAQAANAAPAAGEIRIQMGQQDRDFRNSSSEIIPPETTAPVTSTINIDQEQTLADLKIPLEINHSDATQLIVELTSPGGTTVRLHDRSHPVGNGIYTTYGLLRFPDGPGSLEDYVGESTLGDWTLSIQDVDGSGSTSNGLLYSWGLNTEISGGWDCATATCPEPTPTEAPGLAVSRMGDDLVLDWVPVAGAPHHHVLQSADPTFGDAVELLLRATVETTHTVDDGVVGTPDLTFFQVRATNACNLEGP